MNSTYPYSDLEGKIFLQFSISCVSFLILKLLGIDLKPNLLGLWLYSLEIYYISPYCTRTYPVVPLCNEHHISYLTMYKDTIYSPYLLTYNISQPL